MSKKINNEKADETEFNFDKPFGTAINGFNKSEVNLCVNALRKRITNLELMLEKSYKSENRADYETQIIELQKELETERKANIELRARLERLKNNDEMIEKPGDGDDFGDFKDMVL